MYRELLSGFIKNCSTAKLQPPCSEDKIEKTEKYVGFTFPAELKNLLRETDGDNWLLLSAEEIMNHVKANREIYPAYLDEDEFEEKINRFVYFATNGCGDYYCYRVLSDDSTDTSAIYIWEHELFEVIKVADNISQLITKYYSDEI